MCKASRSGMGWAGCSARRSTTSSTEGMRRRLAQVLMAGSRRPTRATRRVGPTIPVRSARPARTRPLRQAAYQPSVREGTERLGQPFAVAPTQPSRIGAPPELAAAMARAASQQRMVRRTLTRSLFGFLLPVVLVGGLVVVGFVVVDQVSDGIVSPFGSGAAPDQPFEGVVGTPGDVSLGENTRASAKLICSLSRPC